MADGVDIDSLNKSFYENKTVADWYATKEFVLAEEQAFLNDFSGELKGSKLLDIGIGAGRSTRFLIPLAGSYVGVDYSSEMVKESSVHFPDARLEVRDARDLSAYANAEFDVVVFSFNGMDCLSHEGRLQAMNEIQRVLKPGGLFAFSSHNRDRQEVKPYALQNLILSKHPISLLKNLAQFWRGIRNWQHSSKLRDENAEYSLRSDSSNLFTTPLYYISKDAVCQQLERHGFQVEAMYDRKGQRTNIGEFDAISGWFFFASRKRD
jgi:ubiquinone/menaquinone biosynthesis C-methylase UbiE